MSTITNPVGTPQAGTQQVANTGTQPKTQAAQETGRADLKFNYGGKSYPLEVVVLGEKVYLTGKDKDVKAVYFDTGLKTKETDSAKLKTLAEGFLNTPNPNAKVTEFIGKVAPTKVEKNSIEVGVDLLTGAVTSELTVPIGKGTKFVSNMGPNQFTASVSIDNLIVPNLTGTGGVNVLTGQPYGNLKYKIPAGENLSFTTSAGFSANGTFQSSVTAKLEF